MPLVKIEGRDIGIHALVIGVSDYTYLPGDDDPARGGGKLGMKKLKTPAFGAFRFHEWLKQTDEQGRLIKPLASHEIILAPSAAELAIPRLAGCVDDAKTENVISRIREWRKRVAGSPNNVAVFYFTGHGIQRNKDDAVLMLQDFAKSGDAMLENTISFYDVFSGMAPSNDPEADLDLSKMGMTQIYFVDACRNLPERIKNFAKLKTRPVFDSYLAGTDNRKAPVFFAAVNDSKAFAEVGKGSYFNRALLAGLERGAEVSKVVGGKKLWPVSIYTLTTAITIEFGKLKTDQNFEPAGHFKDCDFCFLDQAPLVDVTIQVDPEEQRVVNKIKVTQIGVSPPFRWEQPEPAPDHPYAITAPAGIHQLTAVARDGVTCDKGIETINQKNRLWQVQL
jgi:hypothetical protein